MNQAIVDLCRRNGFVTTTSLAKQLKVSRQAAHRQLAAAIEAGALIAEGQARARRYLPAVPAFAFPLANQHEDRVLATLREKLPAGFRSLPEAGDRILTYVLSEMANNAIEHSRGKRMTVQIEIRKKLVELIIEDDGIGAFESIRASRELLSATEAAAEITKGKVTTMPSRHSGEGVFFTSKVVDHFEMTANSVALVIDNTIEDYTIRTAPKSRGTRVALRFALPPTRSLQSVFAAWTEESEFSRTRTIVKLFGLGRDFVSRSEARRLLQGLESFREIFVDFTGVKSIGQGFADEVFRVFPLHHPTIRMVPVNMVDDVKFFVDRAEHALRRQ